MQYELKNRKVTNLDQKALGKAVQGFYNRLQSLYYREEATGRAANINDAAFEFQRELDKACNAPKQYDPSK